MAWSLFEKTGSMLLQLVVSLKVANLLMPDDFAVLAILTFFTSVALVVVDSGFSQALIRKSDPSERDFGSVFIFNMAISLILYAVLTAAAPLVADFYGKPVIARIAPVLFLLLPVSALGVIQNAIYTRQFRFKLLSRVTLASSLAGSAVAIAMALAGCGVWSLVGHRLAAAFFKSAALWLCNRRPPIGAFDYGSIRTMAPFSLRLLGTDIISSVSNNIAQMFIGKMHFGTLGYFNQAQKVKDMPVASAMQSVQSVTYPALAKISHDETKFAESYRQLLMTVAFMMFPVMAGLAAVADDMFRLLLDEKWMPTVPYLRILAMSGLFAPLAGISLNVLKVKTDGHIILNLEIAKKTVMILILAATVMHSVKAVAWGLVAVSFSDFAITLFAASRHSSLSLLRVVRTLLPVAFVSAAMYAAVMFSGTFAAEWNAALRLMMKIAVGAAVYAALAFGFRLESAREIRSVLTYLFVK